MTLDNYIQKLVTLVSYIDERIEHVVEANSSVLLDTLKRRLFNKGLDGDNSLIGHYSEATIEIKNSKGEETAFITLYSTGGFYNGMYVKYVNNTIIIDSNHDKTELLKSAYGPAILTLTESELEDFISNVLEPYINNMLDENNSVDI